MRSYYLRWLLVLLLVFSCQLKADESEGMALLEKMTAATQHLNYEGVFTYQSGNKLQAIRIYHRSDARGEMERLVALNGAAREVIRSNDMVTCITPDKKQVNISRHPVGGGFPSDLPRRLSSAQSYYHLEVGDIERIADHTAQELVIKAVDNYRYGYRLWMDTDTHLLLKSELIDEQGDVLESFSFSSLNVGVYIPEHKLQSQLQGKISTWDRSEHESSANDLQDRMSDWQIDWLPQGFDLVAAKIRSRVGKSTNVEQRVFSDGLSSVSIFIEKNHAGHNHLKGTSHVGAIHAYGAVMAAHFVTVVGEVPSRTVEKIGQSIKYTVATQP